MNLKKTFLAAGLAAVAFAAQQAAGALEVGITDWSIDGDTGEDVATIAYNITEPCVVTMDIITNTTGGAWHSGDKYVSIGGENIVPGVSADSDVWKKVSSSPGMIKWRPGRAWKDNKTLADAMRVVVTAWPLTNPPPYMVVDITEGAATNASRSVCDNIRYYQSEDFVPGGVLGNVRYRQSALLMRKITAKDITWTMGSAANDDRPEGLQECTANSNPKYNMVANEASHQVTLTNNYYMAVFPITQAQWAIMRTKNQYPSWFTNRMARIMCPVEQVSYAQIRLNDIVTADNNSWDGNYEFPRDPNPKSYLGLLRSRTGVNFDLPGEAQWEWACRAGHGYGYWGDGLENTYDGSRATATNENQLAVGRSSPQNRSGDETLANASDGRGRNLGAEEGTAVCGSYKANSWGIYDMLGNVREICLDWTDENAVDLDYRVNIDPARPGRLIAPLESGQTYGIEGKWKVRRGGCWTLWPNHCRPARRQAERYDALKNCDGFRVMCPAEVP